MVNGKDMELNPPGSPTEVPSEVGDRLCPERTESCDSGISDPEDLAGTDMEGDGAALRDCVVDSPPLAEVKREARNLACDIVIYKSQGVGVSRAEPSHSKTMRRMVDQISEKHQILFAGILRKLNIENVAEARLCFVRVIDELFCDKQFNWGRIVTTYAFAGSLAKYGAENNTGSHFIDMIGKETGDYVAKNLSDWIVQQGGWDTMDKFFEEEEPVEAKMWKGLLYTIMGLGALATTVAVIR